MCLVLSMLKFPLLGLGTGLGPGCLPVLSQAHEDLKFWILNGSLFLADLFGLNCYMFSAYFYAPVLVHKPNQEQEQHCSASTGCTGWSPPKPWQSPCPAPLGPCQFLKGSEGVKARVHGHIPPYQCPPADLIPHKPLWGDRDEPERCGACWSKKSLTHTHLDQLMSLDAYGKLCDIPLC